MIETAQVEPGLAEPLHGSRVLVERFIGDGVDTQTGAAVLERVKVLTLRVTTTQACAVVEHLFGALPLVERFFDAAEERLAAVRSGAELAALAVFTPVPEHGWGAAALAGESTGRGLRVRGEIRVANHDADGSIVLVRLRDGGERLAWLAHDASGVEPRGSRTGGRPRSHAPRWLAVEGAMIAEAHVSRPVTLVAGSELYACLERYVSVWAVVALDCARRTVRALRRAARTTRACGHPDPFSVSQAVSMDLTELEIEIELTAAAAARHHAQAAPHPSGLVLALTAARAIGTCAATANALRDHLGVSVDDVLAEDGGAVAIAAHVGGAWMLENELARAIGLGSSLPR